MNGIYEYATESGGSQIWSRTDDVPNGVDEAGFLTFVSEGTDNGGISWINNVSPSEIGTNNVTMVKFSTLKIQGSNGIEIKAGTPATIQIVPEGTFTTGKISASFFGSLNGNASTATQAGSVSNALTEGTTSATGKTYLNDFTYNGSSATSIIVNAATGATGDTLVARDSNGDFSAGTITAQKFVGPLANALSNGSFVNSFTYNGTSAATISINATNVNTQSTVVARDTNGNFSAGTITASLNGNASTATTATTATTADTLSGSASINTTGNITASNINATTVTTTSDIRLKSDIRNLENSLDKVCQLRGVQYRLNDSENINIGMIAQEVESIIPEVVTEDKDGFKGLQYQNIVSLLVESIKELKKEIEILKNN